MKTVPGVLSVASLYLQIQHIRHSLGSLLLSCCSDMGIGVQGEPGGEVAEHTGYSLDVYSVLEGDGCEGVAEVVESDLGIGKHILNGIFKAFPVNN